MCIGFFKVISHSLTDYLYGLEDDQDEDPSLPNPDLHDPGSLSVSSTDLEVEDTSHRKGSYACFLQCKFVHGVITHSLVGEAADGTGTRNPKGMLASAAVMYIVADIRSMAGLRGVCKLQNDGLAVSKPTCLGCGNFVSGSRSDNCGTAGCPYQLRGLAAARRKAGFEEYAKKPRMTEEEARRKVHDTLVEVSARDSCTSL